jgi:hypothetical protein
MWSALILISWICVLLASANAALAGPPQKPDRNGQETDKNTAGPYYQERQSSKGLAAFQPFQPVPEQPQPPVNEQHSIAESEKTIARFTIVLAVIGAIQAGIAWMYSRYAKGFRPVENEAYNNYT